MSSSRDDPRSTAAAAMVCSAIIGAQYVAALTTRDSLFLATSDASARPFMIVAAGAIGLAVVAVNTRLLRVVAPGVLIPGLFALNALLLIGDWFLASAAPELAARALFLQTNGLGPALGSGFWLVVHEQFDPRTGRRYFGRISAVQTVAGLAGALLAAQLPELLGPTGTLPLLAALNAAAAWQVRRLGRVERDRAPVASDEVAPLSFFTLLAQRRYLRVLAALLLFGTMSSTFVEHLLNVEAQRTLSEDQLPRFFAIYYAGVGVLSLVAQMTLGAFAFERLGLGVAMASPSLAFAAGGAGALFVPGLAAVTAVYGAGSLLYESLFKKASELFLTPLMAAERRAVKMLLDLVPNRIGLALSSLVISAVSVVAPEHIYPALLLSAAACALVAVAVSRWAGRTYVETLEQALRDRALHLDLSDVHDLSTRTSVLRSLQSPMHATEGAPALIPQQAATPAADPTVEQIRVLRSRDRAGIIAVLRTDGPLAAPLVHHTIRLLAWDAVAEAAVTALRSCAEEHVGELTDALLDPNEPYGVRRRLPRVFSVCVSQRAADGLLGGLEDPRFEVRFHCARSLAAVTEKNPGVRLDADAVLSCVRREATVGRPVWEAQRALQAAPPDEPLVVHDFLRDRGNQSLAHVFTLLSFVLPVMPLRISYRALHSDDPVLKATALEYLDGVLPPDIRDRLWPFVSDEAPPAGPPRPAEELLATLLKGSGNIELNLEELRRRGAQRS